MLHPLQRSGVRYVAFRERTIKMFACTPQSPLTAMNDQKPETGVTDSCSAARGPMTLSATVAAIVDIPRYNIYAGHHTGIVGILGELCSYCSLDIPRYNKNTEITIIKM